MHMAAVVVMGMAVIVMRMRMMRVIVVGMIVNGAAGHERADLAEQEPSAEGRDDRPTHALQHRLGAHDL